MNQRTPPPGKGTPDQQPAPGQVPPAGAAGMLSRTRAEAVAFAHPFRLQGWSQPFPAGTYTVETEEALVEPLSFPAWRRVATTLMAAGDRRGALAGVTEVDPRALAEAKRADISTTRAMAAASEVLPLASGSVQVKRAKARLAGGMGAWRPGHRA